MQPGSCRQGRLKCDHTPPMGWQPAEHCGSDCHLHSNDMLESVYTHPVLPAGHSCICSLRGVGLVCYSAVGVTITFTSRVSLAYGRLA